MTVDLTDPESIAAWIEIWPERHIGQLRGLWKLQGQFRHQIAEGVKLHEARSKDGREQSRDSRSAPSSGVQRVRPTDAG